MESSPLQLSWMHCRGCVTLWVGYEVCTSEVPLGSEFLKVHLILLHLNCREKDLSAAY